MDDAAPQARHRTDIPPQPWRLYGELHAAMWLIPARNLAFPIPPGFRPVRLGGRCLVGATWASYREPGVLSYDELAVGVLLRAGLSLAATLPWIWVDSAAAELGGRALWAIPKARARFGDVRRPRFEGRAMVRAEPIAACRFEPGRALPGRWVARLSVAQPDGAGARVTPAQVRGRVSLTRSDWRGGGPLAFLSGRRPLLSVRLDRAEMVFGDTAEALR